MHVHHHGQGPTDDEPSDEQLLDLAGRMNAPENEIPAAVPISTLLARTDDVAIALIGAQAYSAGLRFDLAVRLRQEPRGTMAQKSFALLHGYPEQGSDDPLLLGVEYADGRTATNIPGAGWAFGPVGADPDQPSLSPAGGGGGGRSYDQSFWLTPLPPAGPLLVICAWWAVGIAETRTTLDGAAILAAGSLAVTLWPPLPPQDREPFEPRMPRVPDGGWFAEVVARGQRGPDPTG
ncbi:MAG TPA: hypothetical protein VIU11_22330 [Nakamurella sp.]